MRIFQNDDEQIFASAWDALLKKFKGAKRKKKKIIVEHLLHLRLKLLILSLHFKLFFTSSHSRRWQVDTH